jgi:hypothetical protein
MNLDEVIKKLAVDYGNLKISKNGVNKTTLFKQKGYAISNKMSIYEYLQTIAETIGVDIFMDVNDELNIRSMGHGNLTDINMANKDNLSFLKWIPERGPNENGSQNRYIHEFVYGLNIVDIEIEKAVYRTRNLEIINPVDSSVSQGTYTLTPIKINNEIEGDFNDNLPIRLNDLSVHPLKKYILTNYSVNDLGKIRNCLTRKCKDRLIGRLEVIGDPQVRLNDGVRIKKFELDGVKIEDKIFIVKRVEHFLNMTDGFVTRIGIEEDPMSS